MGGIDRIAFRDFVERMTGYEVVHWGPMSFGFVNRKRTQAPWFSARGHRRDIFRKLGIDLVIDIGANEGQFARSLRSFYSGDIISFEPITEVFTRLSRMASVDKKWKVCKMALGSKETTQRINISRDAVFSSLLRTNEYAGLQFQESEIVGGEMTTVRRLESVLDEVFPSLEERRIFLKLDTQGWDLEVFSGLGNKIRHVWALQSELSVIPLYEGMPHWLESLTTYEKAGFGVTGIFPVNRDESTFRIIEYDCIMVRKGNP